MLMLSMKIVLVNFSQNCNIQPYLLIFVRHNTQHNGTQHNDSQDNDTQHNATQHNDTQNRGIIWDIQSNNTMTLCLMSLGSMSYFIYSYTECHFAEYRYAECLYAECWHLNWSLHQATLSI